MPLPLHRQVSRQLTASQKDICTVIIVMQSKEAFLTKFSSDLLADEWYPHTESEPPSAWVKIASFLGSRLSMLLRVHACFSVTAHVLEGGWKISEILSENQVLVCDSK
jgi:hypothetical protein